MREPIPERIVTALEGLGEELAAWCAEGQDRDLAAHEQAVLERVRAALPRLLGPSWSTPPAACTPG